MAWFSIVGDHCTQIFGEGGGDIGRRKVGGNVWVIVLLGFRSDVVIFIAVATF